MGHADDELLAALSLGEDDVPDDVREHVATCSTCRRRVEDLAETAALARSLRGESLAEPPPEVWLRIAAELTEDQQVATSVVAAVPGPTDVVSRRPRVRRRAPVWLVAAAAAVALVAGLAGGWAAGHRSERTDTDVVASTTLETLTGHQDLGSAQIVWAPGDVTLRVSMVRMTDAGGLREVWLLNDDGKRMVALGLLQSDDHGAFAVPQRLLDEGYRTVDISVEPDDGNPAHSGVSVARGTLADS